MAIQSAIGSETGSSSFELVRTEKLPDYQGEGRLYRHPGTGMEVFHVSNSDTELFAGFMFKTLPLSSNGLPHILEHTVLSGSKNFPVKDPFMDVSMGSANTFMNAITYPGCTFYPFSSVLKKDFDNIFAVYSDAVFAPLLRKETFLLEGIRQTGDRFDGVVFNEMKGSYSDQESLVSAYSQMGLFKGTPYGFDSGGRIDEIPKLTYEEYLAGYRRWYNPSGCRLFLYGDLDAEQYMAYLEQHYLKDAQAAPECCEPSTDISWNSPFSLEVPGPDSENSTVMVCWATKPESDPLQLITLSVLVDILLGDPGNPLYRAISESSLGEDLSEESGMGVGFRFMPFSVGFSGADRSDAPRIEQFMLDTLKDICRRGLDPKLVKASLKSEEFALQEVQRNYYPIGYSASQRAMRGWMDGKTPFETIRTTEPLSALKDQLERDPQYFEHWIQDNLIDNPLRMLLTVYPDPDYEKSMDKRLISLLSHQTKKEMQSQKKALESFAALQDKSEDLARIGHLSREDLGDRFLKFDYSQHLVSGRTAYVQNMFTNGICYFTLNFDTRDLSEWEHRLLLLLLRLMWMTGIDGMDYSQVAIRLKELTGSASMVPTCAMTLGGDEVSSATALVKTLGCDSHEALQFILRIMLKCDLVSPERVKAAITDLVTSFKSNFIEEATSFAIRRATSAFTGASHEQENVSGITQWVFLSELSSRPECEVSKMLCSLRDKLIVRQRFSCQVGCGKEATDDCLKALEDFASSLPENGSEVCPNSAFYDESRIVKKSELFLIPGQVAYNAFAINLEKQSESDRVGKLVLGAILSDNGLWDRVRSKGGAYMAEARMGMYNSFFYFSSYRDPRINGTVEDFRHALEDVIANGVDEKILESEIISLAGRELRPRSPMDVCAEGRKRFILGLSDQVYNNRIKLLLGLKSQDIRAQASDFLEAMDRCPSSLVVIAPKSLAAKNGLDLSGALKLSF
ncbi:MAG: insulinase family protein [Sphaerochaetaceae bacterium]